MNPGVTTALQWVADFLEKQIIPEITDNYTRFNAVMAARVVKSSIEKIDAIVDNLVRENQMMESLLQRGASCAQSFDRTPGLGAVGSGRQSLTISALTATNESLRSSLVKLHEQIETLDTPEAEALNREIWTYLIQNSLDACFKTNPLYAF